MNLNVFLYEVKGLLLFQQRMGGKEMTNMVPDPYVNQPMISDFDYEPIVIN